MSNEWDCSMMERDELIWIQDAVASYRRSREWLNKQMREGRLDKVGLPGDGKVYLRRSQLAELAALLCKIEGCDEPARRCGVCGHMSCDRHGHLVRSEIVEPAPMKGTIIDNWICNDCGDRLVEAFRQHPPTPKRPL